MRKCILVALLLGSIALPLFAGGPAPLPFTPIVNDSACSDTGGLGFWQDNMGRFFKGCAARGGMRFLTGAGGIWVGVLDPMRTGSDTAVTWGFDPGTGKAEFCPTTPDGDASRYLDSLARIYKSSNPRDTAQWPERDSSGRAIISSDQELWVMDNDLGPFMVYPDSAIGVQVTRRTYGWHSGNWEGISKIEFDVKNVTGRWGGNPHTLPQVILGLSLKTEIGEASSNSNDLYFLGCVSGSAYPNLVVQYQLVQEPGWSIMAPYFVGYRCFVESPKATDTVRVRDSQYPHTILPGEPLGATAIKIYTDLPDPQTAYDRYLLLNGMFSSSDTDNAYGGNGGPGNHRFLVSCGPFTLPNDSTVRLSFHLFGALDSAQLWRLAEMLDVESPPQPVSPNPSGVVLYPSIPNPSFGSCIVRYALPEPSGVALRIYDISGRLVRVLEQGTRSSGPHSVPWDGTNDRGRFVSSGIYFLRLEAGNSQVIRQTVVVR